MHPTSKRSATATSHSDIYTVPKTGLNKFLALSSSVLVLPQVRLSRSVPSPAYTW